MKEKYLKELEKYNCLVNRKNIETQEYNGIYKRYKYPVLTRKHVPLSWRYDLNEESNPNFIETLGIDAVFNPGAIELNDEFYLVTRMEGSDRKSFFAIAKSNNGIDNYKFINYPVVIPDTCIGETNLYDMRLTKHEDGFIYGIFC